MVLGKNVVHASENLDRVTHGDYMIVTYITGEEMI